MNTTQDVKEIYGDTLYELMKENRDIAVVDADLMRIAGTERIAGELQGQYVNTGIAEQNAVSVAAGLAAMGKTVFVSAFCEFLATRASDQCLDTVCYNGLDVKLIGTYAGISSGLNGGTHISINDLAAFRSMPGMKVMEAADGRELAWAIREAADVKGPVYIRVPKGPLHEIFPNDRLFQMGKGQLLSEISQDDPAVKRIALVTSGITTYEGMGAAKLLHEKGISITHVHMTSIKPIDQELILSLAGSHDVIVTADNHSVIGGLGSAVCEITSADTPVQVVRLGVDDEFCEGMTERQLAQRHGISSVQIAKTIQAVAEASGEGGACI